MKTLTLSILLICSTFGCQVSGPHPIFPGLDGNPLLEEDSTGTYCLSNIIIDKYIEMKLSTVKASDIVTVNIIVHRPESIPANINFNHLSIWLETDAKAFCDTGIIVAKIRKKDLVAVFEQWIANNWNEAKPIILRGLPGENYRLGSVLPRHYESIRTFLYL